MMTFLTGIELIGMAFLATAAGVSGHTEGTTEMTKAVFIVHDNDALPIEKHAMEAFARRLSLLSDLDVITITEAKAVRLEQQDSRRCAFLVLAGVADSKNRLFGGLVAAPPLAKEGFQIIAGENQGWTAEVFHATRNLVIVRGQDSRGMLFGLGKLLRIADFTDHGFSAAPQTCVESPATAQRGVYFATHFNNFYESAPLEEIETYIEDMAFWGFNTIGTWFDMSWYPDGFWKDPDSKGMQLLKRIHKINEKTRSLGLTVGVK